MRFKQKTAAFAVLLAVLLTMCVVAPYGVMRPAAAAENVRVSVIPAGTPFGIKFYTKGVIVVGVTDIQTYEGVASPAGDAGIRAGDVITHIDGKEINSTDDIADAIAKSGGKQVELTVTRGENSFGVTLTPKKASGDNIYKAGLWVRDSTAGIGTMTYISADGKKFAGLGHGICDPETGDCLPLLKGLITDVTITGIVKGADNAPGELKGEFSAYKRGVITANTECGIFGKLDASVRETYADAKAVEVAFRNEVKTGTAHILTMVNGSAPLVYEIKIVKIYENSGKTKNFIIEVTDKELLALTGGIVQGMSGSPIIQDGRLVGAVTHVMVNNPARGYGIFAENMVTESGY